MIEELGEDRNWKEICIWLLLFLLVLPYLIYLGPQLIDMRAYIVESGSMAPEMPKGSIVYESWRDPRGYEVGDVVLFRPDNSEIEDDLVIHRITDIREGNYTNYFQTQGDANPEPDPGWTPGYNIIGERTFWIPYLGYYIMFTSSRPVLYLIILLPAALIIRNQLENLLDAIEEEKEKKNRNSKSDSVSVRTPLENKNNDENNHKITYKDL